MCRAPCPRIIPGQTLGWAPRAPRPVLPRVSRPRECTPVRSCWTPSGQGGSGGRYPGQAGRARGSKGEPSGAGGWRTRRGPISTPLPGCTLLPSPGVKHANLPESWVGKGEQPKASSGCVTTSSENSAFPLLETSRGGWERPAPRGGEKVLEFPRCRLGLF